MVGKVTFIVSCVTRYRCVSKSDIPELTASCESVKGAGKWQSPVAHFQGDSAVVSLMHVPVPARLEVDADTDSSARS